MNVKVVLAICCITLLSEISSLPAMDKEVESTTFISTTYPSTIIQETTISENVTSAAVKEPKNTYLANNKFNGILNTFLGLVGLPPIIYNKPIALLQGASRFFFIGMKFLSVLIQGHVITTGYLAQKREKEEEAEEEAENERIYNHRQGGPVPSRSHEVIKAIESPPVVSPLKIKQYARTEPNALKNRLNALKDQDCVDKAICQLHTLTRVSFPIKKLLKSISSFYPFSLRTCAVRSHSDCRISSEDLLSYLLE